MLSSFRHCVGNLSNFAGRDSRRTFWSYALVVLPLPLIIWVSGFEIFLADVFDRQTEYFENLVADHPERATITETDHGRSLVFDRGYDPPPGPHDAELVWKATGVFLATIIVGATLLSATATRRLHDTGRSAVGVLVVLAGYFGFAMLFPTIYVGQELVPAWLIGIVFAVTFGALFWAVAVFCFLLLPSDKQSNRYGPPSDS